MVSILCSVYSRFVFAMYILHSTMSIRRIKPPSSSSLPTIVASLLASSVSTDHAAVKYSAVYNAVYCSGVHCRAVKTSQCIALKFIEEQ